MKVIELKSIITDFANHNIQELSNLSYIPQHQCGSSGIDPNDNTEMYVEILSHFEIPTKYQYFD